MGNAQSSDHHNRLSKPKTNSNSPFGIPKTDSCVSVYSKYANLSPQSRQQLKTQLTSPVETEFGSGVSYPDDDGIGELASHVQVRLSSLSRSNSVASQIGSRNSNAKLASLPGSKLSLVSQNQGVDLETAIKIVKEVRRTASPEDLAALHEALQASAPSSILDQRISSDVNRSSSSLIRRRSLIATPGLATRNSPPSDKIRRTWNSWKTSQHSDEKKWKKVEMIGGSPLTRLAALNADGGRDSPTPRAQTPGDMDYSHLGSLKLGSLVVTNGAPSPAASARMVVRRRSNADIPHEEDYFTISAGSASPVMWKTSRQRAHSRSKSSVHTQTPLRDELQVLEELREAKIASRGGPSMTVSKPHNPADESKGSVAPISLRLHVVNKSAEALARDYVSEIPDSPFNNSTVVKQDDEGYSDTVLEDVSPFREEAFRILDGTIFGEPAAILAPPKLTTEQVTTPEKSQKTKKSRRPTPSKADSGYSSGGSFRTANRSTLHGSPALTLSKKPSVVAEMLNSAPGSDGDDAASLYTIEQMLALPTLQILLPAVPIEEISDREPPKLHGPESLIEQSPISPRTTKSVASQGTTDSALSQKRLQKRRPSVPNLPVVQSCQPVAEGTIPSIPDNVRSKFVRRLSEAPEMECLTKTYLSKDHNNSEESVDCSPVTISLEFSAPSSSSAEPPRHHKRSHTERPPTPPPHGLRRSLSMFWNKQEVEKRQGSSHSAENAAITVIDLGTIGSALGESPYDIAMSALPKKAITTPTHPHQLGNALPRAKSMVNMDARMATEVARMRSKDRALLRPEMPQRPRSYHDINPDAGEAAAFRRRPHAIYADAPPVPRIENDRLSPPREPHRESVEDQTSTGATRGLTIRARTTGRGPVVSHLVDRYDHHVQQAPQGEQPNWESHARLWSQRRKSLGEGLRPHANNSQISSSTINQRASSQPPEDMVVIDRYSGGLDYGYEGRGYGIGGSAGTRQLHSAASRKSMHFSTLHGVDLSDIPVFVQRI